MARFTMTGVGPNATPAPDTWNPLADLNPDGKIDIKDALALTGQGFSLTDLFRPV